MHPGQLCRMRSTWSTRGAKRGQEERGRKETAGRESAQAAVCSLIYQALIVCQL